ncbi:MAG TPA: hypothetical protein VJ958_01340 [Atribacterota bacterium]|nr:hypothetical protein [Atribacterota bacterium]
MVEISAVTTFRNAQTDNELHFNSEIYITNLQFVEAEDRVSS